jgi:hypothetical protein
LTIFYEGMERSKIRYATDSNTLSPPPPSYYQSEKSKYVVKVILYSLLNHTVP